MDGTFGEPFILWEDQRISRHGVSAVRMPTVDIICWAEAYRYDNIAGQLPHYSLGRRLPHDAYQPDSSIEKLGRDDILLTRDYYEPLEAGLIEVSGDGFYSIQEDMTTTKIETIPALSFGYDVFSLNEDYSLYVAHDDTLKHFKSFLDTVPIVKNQIQVESFWGVRPISWFGVDRDGNLIASTFLLNNGSSGQSEYRAFDKIWQLDTALRVIGEEQRLAGYFYVYVPPGVKLSLGSQGSESKRTPNNGTSRWLYMVEPKHEQLDHEINHPFHLLRNRYGGFVAEGSEMGKSHLTLLEEPYDVVPYSTVDRLGNDLSIVYPRRNPKLHLKAESFTRESATNERSPHLTMLDDRIFASWLNHTHPKARHTVEILRDGSGGVTIGEEQVDRDTAGGRSDVLEHHLISVGPHTVSELLWRVGNRTYRELSLLREENGEIAWRPIYQDSYTGDTGVSTTNRFYAESFYDPDERLAWITSGRYHYTPRYAAIQLSTQTLQVSHTGNVVDTIDLYVPLDTNGKPFQSRLVKYYPIDSISYLVKTRDHSLHVVDGVVVDTLTILPGMFGQVTPDFGGRFVERRFYSESTVGISRHYPEFDSTLHYGLSDPLRPDAVHGKTLVHPVDSTAMLLFGSRHSARLQSYDRLRASYVFQDASAGDLQIVESSGFFSGDTLWVVMAAKEREGAYQIRLNAVLPDVKTLSLPQGVDIHAIRELWLR